MSSKRAMALPNIHNPEDFAELMRRIENLKSDSPRRWGKMTPSQACVHLCDAVRAAMGELSFRWKGNFLTKWVGRTFFLSSRPWPRSLPTAPELMQTRPHEDFEVNRRMLMETLRRAVQKGTEGDWG
ncbi:MAG: hypothetical protein NZ534_07310, partial [Bacteroidia bacterium]|nr:hypothetical protein [Bacteroidia bacterium]